MNISEIENLIEIEEKEIGDGLMEVRAKLTITAEPHFYDAQRNTDHGGYLQLQARNQARERLLRDLFEDRTRELMFALSEVCKCQPFEYEKLAEARGKLIRAALRMPRKKLEGPEF